VSESFFKRGPRVAALVWLVAACFLFASAKSIAGVHLLAALHDGHHAPVVSFEHGRVHFSLAHDGGHHHDDHAPPATFGGPSHHSRSHHSIDHGYKPESGHDHDHEAHFHDFVEEATPGKRLGPWPGSPGASARVVSRLPIDSLSEPAPLRGAGPPVPDQRHAILSTVVILS